MNITVKINGVDQTENILWNSLQKSDVINDKVDNLSFSVNRYGSKTFEPQVSDAVEMLDDGQTVYKGLILTVQKVTDGHTVIRYEVDCVDNTYYLNRILVAESYVNTTVERVINDILQIYAPGFTLNAFQSLGTETGELLVSEASENLYQELVASLDIPIKSIVFNRISVTEVLQKLARLTNYSWYVDYDNDIHFFAKNTELAPFNLTDSSANYVFESLEVSDDISQLRNRVFIQGGEAKGDPRAETFTGNGANKFFQLSNKFAEIYDDDHIQTLFVTVDGVNQTIGVDYLNDEADFDVLWSFNEKYLKFTNPPADTAAIEVNGIPLYSILVQVENTASISEYGLSEFAKTDTTIKSKEEAKAFAVSELGAYSTKISEGSFTTYTPGLRSGQTISVNSTLRGISEDFLIQKVTFQMVSRNVGIYKIDLATLKTITLIDFLITELRRNATIINEETILLQKFSSITESLTVSDTVTVQALNYPVAFRLAPQPITGYIRPFILDGSRLS